MFAARFKTSELADDFKKKYEECQKDVARLLAREDAPKSEGGGGKEEDAVAAAGEEESSALDEEKANAGTNTGATAAFNEDFNENNAIHGIVNSPPPQARDPPIKIGSNVDSDL